METPLLCRKFTTSHKTPPYHTNNVIFSTADDTPTTLDGLLEQLEGALKTALDTFGPALGLTDDQIKAAEADIDTLIKDIEAAEHGHTDIDTAVEKIVTDIMNLLKDLGAPVLRTSYGATSKLPITTHKAKSDSSIL